MNKEKGLLIGTLAGVLLCVFSLITAIILNNFEGNLLTILKLLICILSSAIGGVVSVNKKKTVLI